MFTKKEIKVGIISLTTLVLVGCAGTPENPNNTQNTIDIRNKSVTELQKLLNDQGLPKYKSCLTDYPTFIQLCFGHAYETTSEFHKYPSDMTFFEYVSAVGYPDYAEKLKKEKARKDAKERFDKEYAKRKAEKESTKRNAHAPKTATSYSVEEGVMEHENTNIKIERIQVTFELPSK